MKKNVTLKLLTLTVIMAFLLLEQNSFAQGSKVNFSGAWAFNESKSDVGGGGGRGFRMGSSQMTVTQEGMNLTIARIRTNRDGEQTTTTDKYTMDGKEIVNESSSGRGGPTKTTVSWSADGKTLNFAVTRTFEREGQTMEMKSSEAWTLTDARTLSVVSTFNTPDGEMKTTLVYDKK
jgi:hypothetical protein